MSTIPVRSWHERLWRIFDAVLPGDRSYLNVGFGDGGSIDAFGRARVSNPVTLFDSQLQYDDAPLLWETQTAGSATTTHIPDESALDLTVTTASGDRVTRQTYEYFRYQPGKSQLILCTFVMGAGQANTEKLVGYGDDENGIFLGQDGGGLFVLLRSSSIASGVTDTKIYQTSWNVDAFDGTGSSGVNLDPTKTQIFVADMEWLGVGRVRVGFNINGITYYAHQFLNANAQTTTYMTTANLPIRYEIQNTALAAAGATLKQICCQVSSEGGVQETDAYPSSTVLSGLSVPNGAGNAIVAFAAQHRTTFNSITNRGQFVPKGFELIATGGRVVASLLYDPTLTGGTWSNIDTTNSIMEGNTTVTSFSGGLEGGISLFSGGNAKAATAGGKAVTARLPFGLGIAGTTPIPLALVVYALDANVTADISFTWDELR